VIEERVLRSGGLIVIARFEGEVLRVIDLPKEPAEELTALDLRGMIEQLEQLPVTFDGGPLFHQRVWKRLRRIPWGTALTYAELAREVESPRAFRAVGQACGANPLPLLVPCHRVLAQDGLGGFSSGLAWKERLLDIEAD
jgi:O-6-methylguanine DNA methyltransferase